MAGRKTNTKASTSRCSCTGLRKATRRVSMLYDAALAPSGLKITQRAILAQLGRSGPVNVGALAEALVMDSGALAHTLRPLERDGLIGVEVDPDDRRHRLIGLTAQGKLKLSETDVLWARAEKKFESAFGRAETESLRRLVALLISDDFSSKFENGAARSTSK